MMFRWVIRVVAHNMNVRTRILCSGCSNDTKIIRVHPVDVADSDRQMHGRTNIDCMSVGNNELARFQCK